jgi:hypothetical protein
MKLEDFWGCLEALTACIGNGRNVCFRGRECTRVTKKGCTVILEAVATYDL